MDDRYVQNLVANLSESYARRIQVLEIDLALARTERDTALTKVKELTEGSTPTESAPESAPGA